VRDSKTKPISLFIVGCGDLGIRIFQQLPQTEFVVSGVCRSPDRLPEGITGYRANYCEAGSLSFLEAAAPDYVVATFKPLENSADGYQLGFVEATRNLLQGLGSHSPELILMVSSTRVFAEREGGWVDESSALADEGFAATAIVDAEQLLRNSGRQITIARAGGIYGDPEGRLLNRVASGELYPSLPVHYSNRIHRDDCAGFLAHLLSLGESEREPVYMAVDNHPVSQAEVALWLAGQMQITEKSGSVSVRGRGHKRCSNQRMRQSGYVLKYPDYRAGYAAVLEDRRGLRG
jgi:nucleoside-diphosphate-sugar epimerase